MSGTILCIINDPPTRATLARVLESSGHHVVLATRAIEGLDLARETPPDLIITQLDLAGMSGRELAMTIRADDVLDQIPILTMLHPEDTQERELCIAAGINGFLNEPLNVEALPIQIQFFLSGGSDVLEDPNRISQVRDLHLRDVLKRLESRIRELERSNADLQRVDEMKDSFIQLTAHELRTPLTLISGYSRLIEDSPSLQQLMQDDPGIAPLMQGLSEAITRMQSVIEDVLTISRIMTSKIELNMTEMTLPTVIGRVLQVYKDALRDRRLHLIFNESEFPGVMRADEGLMQQMFANLLSNAIKYTPDGGTITIAGHHTAQSIRIAIHDTGIGIERSNLQRIFDRMTIAQDVMLHTTSKTTFRGGGLGLGLAICRGIVEAHGGTIRVESPGFDLKTLPGTEVIITLPIVSTPAIKPISRLKKLSARQEP